jgi:hypothetical protein
MACCVALCFGMWVCPLLFTPHRIRNFLQPRLGVLKMKRTMTWLGLTTTMLVLTSAGAFSQDWRGGGGRNDRDDRNSFRCNERRGEYDDESSCRRATRSNCEYDRSSGCYTESNNTSRCDERRSEYEDSSRCERRHGNCEYDRRSGCYVPDNSPVPPTTTTTIPKPSCPSTMPTSVCSSGSQDNGSGWGSEWDAQRHLDERFGAGARRAGQGADCCWH